MLCVCVWGGTFNRIFSGQNPSPGMISKPHQRSATVYTNPPRHQGPLTANPKLTLTYLLASAQPHSKHSQKGIISQVW